MNPELHPTGHPGHDDPLRPHTFDGIQEYDKRLPNWWLWTLWGAVVFSVGYWLWAHTWKLRPTQEELYDQHYAITFPEAAMAKANAVPADADLWKFSRDPAYVTPGSQIFMTTCATCHGADLKGGIGQNLVDATWLHGGNPSQVFFTVQNGVAAKGMPAWGRQLGAKRVQQVVSFVMSHHQPPADSAENPPAQ